MFVLLLCSLAGACSAGRQVGIWGYACYCIPTFFFSPGSKKKLGFDKTGYGYPDVFTCTHKTEFKNSITTGSKKNAVAKPHVTKSVHHVAQNHPKHSSMTAGSTLTHTDICVKDSFFSPFATQRYLWIALCPDYDAGTVEHVHKSVPSL